MSWKAASRPSPSSDLIPSTTANGRNSFPPSTAATNAGSGSVVTIQQWLRFGRRSWNGTKGAAYENGASAPGGMETENCCWNATNASAVVNDSNLVNVTPERYPLIGVSTGSAGVAPVAVGCGMEGCLVARFVEPKCLATLLTKSPMVPGFGGKIYDQLLSSGAPEDRRFDHNEFHDPKTDETKLFEHDLYLCPGVLVVDCRSGGEFERSSIAGSYRTFLPGILKKRMLNGTLVNVCSILSNPEERKIFEKFHRSVPVILVGDSIVGEIGQLDPYYCYGSGSGSNFEAISTDPIDIDHHRINSREIHRDGQESDVGSQMDCTTTSPTVMTTGNGGSYTIVPSNNSPCFANGTARRLVLAKSTSASMSTSRDHMASSMNTHDVIVRRSCSAPMDSPGGGDWNEDDLVYSSMILRSSNLNTDATSTNNHSPISLVYRLLDRMGANVAVLDGGFERFKREYPELLIYCRDQQPDARVREDIFTIATATTNLNSNIAEPEGTIELLTSPTVKRTATASTSTAIRHCATTPRGYFVTASAESTTAGTSSNGLQIAGAGSQLRISRWGSNSSMNNYLDIDSDSQKGANPTAVALGALPIYAVTDATPASHISRTVASPPVPRLSSTSSSDSARSSTSDSPAVWPLFSSSAPWPDLLSPLSSNGNTSHILGTGGYRSVDSIIPDSPFLFPSPTSAQNSSCGISELSDFSSPSTANSSPISREFSPRLSKTNNNSSLDDKRFVLDFDSLLTSVIHTIGGSQTAPVPTGVANRQLDQTSTKRRRRTAPNLWRVSSINENDQNNRAANPSVYRSVCKQPLVSSRSMGLTSRLEQHRRSTSFLGVNSDQDRSSCSELFDVSVDSPQRVPDTSFPSLAEADIFSGNDAIASEDMNHACFSKSSSELPSERKSSEDSVEPGDSDDLVVADGNGGRRKINRPALKFLKRACRPSPLLCLREVPQLSPPLLPPSKPTSMGTAPPGNLSFTFNSCRSRHSNAKYNPSRFDNFIGSNDHGLIMDQHPPDLLLDDGCRSPVLKRPRSFIPINHPLPVEILPSLFLGNAQCSANAAVLEQCNIRFVVNVTPDLPNIFEHDDRFRYLQIPASDHWSQDLLPYFNNAIKFIDAALASGTGVLVHCVAGISRSVTILVAYLMHSRRLSMESAFDLVKSAKSNIAPNFHFMGQLLDFERQLSERSLEYDDLVADGAATDEGGDFGVNVNGQQETTLSRKGNGGSVVPSTDTVCSATASVSSLPPLPVNDCVANSIISLSPSPGVVSPAAITSNNSSSCAVNTSCNNHAITGDEFDQSDCSSSSTSIATPSKAGVSSSRRSLASKRLKRRHHRLTSQDTDGRFNYSADEDGNQGGKHFALSNNIIQSLVDAMDTDGEVVPGGKLTGGDVPVYSDILDGDDYGGASPVLLGTNLPSSRIKSNKLTVNHHHDQSGQQLDGLALEREKDRSDVDLVPPVVELVSDDVIMPRMTHLDSDVSLTSLSSTVSPVNSDTTFSPVLSCEFEPI